MKKVQPNGAQNRKKKRARDEAESRQRRASDVWLKRSRGEVDKTRDEAAENSSDTSIVSQHSKSNEASDEAAEDSSDTSMGVP